MGNPFSTVNDPTRWRDLSREFPFGAHHMWVAQHLFSIAVLRVNDGTLELSIRNRPNLALKGRPTAATRHLTITIRNVVRKSLRIQFDDKGVLIGETYVILNDEGGVLRLATALVHEAERVWNSLGR